ncbi:MAG: GGDEF domain-containing protein, partial [Spirochaetota bacterium]
SVAQMHLLPTSQNLVVLDSVTNQPWWDNDQFLDADYYSKLRNILFLFLIFFTVMLIPLLFYAYLMTNYARDFFRVSRYIGDLPLPGELLEKYKGQRLGHEDLLTEVQEVGPESAMGERLVWEIQRRFIKLGEMVNYWHEQSSIDELTGLLNRKGLNQICSYEFNRMKRSGSNFALILLDIDHFKNVNDQFGHEIGDLALKSLTRALTSTFRTSDYLGRWGGEEFLVVLPDTSLQGAIQAAEEARNTVEKMMIQTENISLQLMISAGVVNSLNGSSFADILNLADKGLYNAKQNGRNQVWAFSQERGFFAVAPRRESGRKQELSRTR